MDIKQIDMDPLGRESDVRFGARELGNEQPGAEWNPSHGEIYVQSLFYESGDAEEYGESQQLHDEPGIRRAARIVQELNPEPGEGSIIPIDDRALRQVFYQRMRALALQSLKAEHSLSNLPSVSGKAPKRKP